MKIRTAAFAGILFVSGIAVGTAAQKAAAPAYRDKPQADAAVALLQTAKVLAGKGSWERIAVGRVYYLGGRKAEGQAIFDEVLGNDPDSSDLFRVGRVYREAGEWERAKPLFARYASENPKDETQLAEIGAYHLMNGDRAGAEAMYDRAFKAKAKPEFWALVAAAGGYLNVAPQE